MNVYINWAISQEIPQYAMCKQPLPEVPIISALNCSVYTSDVLVSILANIESTGLIVKYARSSVALAVHIVHLVDSLCLEQNICKKRTTIYLSVKKMITRKKITLIKLFHTITIGLQSFVFPPRVLYAAIFVNVTVSEYL